MITGLFVTGTFLLGQEAEIINNDYLTILRREAARTHPSAVAASQLAAAAGHDTRSVRLWQDPMVGLGFTIANRMMRMDDGDVTIILEQSLPKPGMFEARRQKAVARDG